MTYTRNIDFEVNDMSDGIVLFDVQRKAVHHLNGPATLVWEIVEGRSFEDVSAAIEQVMEVSRDEARSIAQAAIDQLQQIHAVTQ